jgi:RNA polymerase-binding transcription factor
VEAAVARARLEQMLAELEESARVLQRGGGDTGELTSIDQHPADSGTNLADADREEASIEILHAQQERVRDAIARVDAGTYGRCVDCGSELPDERLEARPDAARCVNCQQKADAGR